MSDEGLIHKPSPGEYEQKISEMRNKLSSKLDRWANTLQFSMYTPEKVQRAEGDQWEEDGKRWEMKAGIKTSITSLIGARMPFWCPKCSISMTHKFDRKFYFLRGWCYNCNIDFEGKMRVDGTWADFEKRTMRENEKAALRDKLTEYYEYIRDFTAPTIIYEDGRFDQLASREVFQPMFDDILADADILIARLEAIAQEEQHELDGTSESAPQLRMESTQSDDASSSGRNGVGYVLDRQEASA